MKNINLLKLDVSKEEFKKIKKGKQTIIIRLNNNEIKEIKSKDKITIKGKFDKFRKKVKDIHVYSNLEELSENIKKRQLGYRKKDILNYDKLIEKFTKEDVKKYGLVGIELKKKKHIFRNIILIILMIVAICYGSFFIKSKIIENEANKFNNNLNDIFKERIDYVFIEINPSFVLTIKNNIVKDVACLNDDCSNIYNDLNIKDKNIDDSIDIIYNTTKENGFDVSNGVKIKISNDVVIEKKDYITIEQIDKQTENNLLKEIINNTDIKYDNNNNYYINLWNTLKEDKDYDNVYTCSMNTNELECYIKKDYIIFSKEFLEFTIENINSAITEFPKIQSNLQKIERVLKKFKFNVGTDYSITLFPMPVSYLYVGSNTFNASSNGETTEDLIYTGRIKCDFYKINLTDINLLKPNDIPYVIDESFYEIDEDDPWIITERNELNRIEELDSNYCNEWNCYKVHDTRKFYCNYDENSSEWIEKEYTSITQKCDLDYTNCVYVSENK